MSELIVPGYWPFEYFGVRFSPIGEEGEHLLAVGHPEPRRVIAAFNRYARRDVGLANLNDDSRADAGDVADLARELKRTWAVWSMECGACSPGEDCSLCKQIQADGGWTFWGRDEAESGSFPVTVLRWY